MGFYLREALVDSFRPGSKLDRYLPHILRGAQSIKYKIDHIEEKSLEQQGHGPSAKEGVDRFPGNVADIIPADVATHGGIDEQYKVGDGAKNKVAENILLHEYKREKIKMEHRKEEHQGKTLVEATFHLNFKEIQCSFQGKKFSWNVLSLAFNDIKLLDLGNRVQQVLWPVDASTVRGYDLGIGIALPSIFPFSTLHLSCS